MAAYPTSAADRTASEGSRGLVTVLSDPLQVGVRFTDEEAEKARAIERMVRANR